MQRNIDIDARADIVDLHSKGLNFSQISTELGISRNTVSRWVKRFKQEGSLKSRERCGRPPLIKPTQRRSIWEEYKTQGFITTEKFAVKFNTSLKTVRRALLAEGFLPRIKPPTHLTQKHKEERLRFARDYLDFNWETTIFSDIKTYTGSGRLNVRMWGWISTQGPGELELQPACANSSNYVAVLNDIMLPTVRNVYPLEDFSELNFVQDNCPINRASVVKEWFSQHADIKVIPWPERSSDLNPIDKIWGLMFQKWKARGERCPEKFKTHCTKFWDNLRGTDTCAKIVASMRERLLSCIENKGGHIKC